MMEICIIYVEKVQECMQKGVLCWIYPICLARPTLHLSLPFSAPEKPPYIKKTKQPYPLSLSGYHLGSINGSQQQIRRGIGVK